MIRSKAAMIAAITACTLMACSSAAAADKAAEAERIEIEESSENMMTEGTDEDNTGDLLARAAAESGLSSSSAADKEETVYVIADATGHKQNVIVSDWLKNTGKTSQLTDYTLLTDPENVKSDNGYVRNADGTITWDAQGADIYYKGTTDKELPIDVKVSYYLDGVEMEPDDIAGKSGRVTIRFDYENRDEHEAMVNGKEAGIYTPYAVISGAVLDADRFSNVEVTGGKVISEGNNLIAMGTALPGLKESLGLDDGDLEEIKNKLSEGDKSDDDNTGDIEAASDEKKSGSDIRIPDYVEISADTTAFSLDMTMTYAGTGLLNDLGLEQGSDAIIPGDLSDKADELTDGADQLEEGSVSLHDGCVTLKDGSKKLLDGGAELFDGSSALASGCISLKDGSSSLAEGAAKLVTGTGSLAAGAVTLKDGTVTLKDGVDKLKSGTSSMKAGTGELLKGTTDLSKGAAELATGTGKLKSGAQTLGTGMASLESSLETFSKGAETLKNNTSGISAAADAVSAIKGALGSGVDETSQNTVIGALNLMIGGMDASKAAGTQKAAELTQAAGSYSAAAAQALQGMQSCLTSSTSDNSLEEKSYDEYLSEYTDNIMKAAEIKGRLLQMQEDSTASETIYNSLVSLRNSAVTLKTQAVDPLSVAISSDNMAALENGISSLSTGADALVQGASQLLSGAQDLSTGITSVDDGANKLSAGSNKVNAGVSSLDSGAAQLDAGVGALSDGTGSLVDGAAKLSGGASELDNGMKSLDAGAQKLNGGAAELASGASSLRDGSLELKNGLGSLNKGAGDLESGALDLSQGMIKFNDEGISKLSDVFGDNLTELSDRLSALADLSSNEECFGGAGEGTSSSVSFIIKTAAVKSDV
ncbi:hypothetical protein [Butyrivibrio sp. MC2013]|uniref:hypothetical protein n=1 Tax=Butyrivibrio sp. MC2013 TaxID=1280686 RepID=UPI0018CBCD1D|nr:hypothetical protein [Butyrivibrio sp. MC2013]